MFLREKPTLQAIKRLVELHDQHYPYSKQTYDAALRLVKEFHFNNKFKDVIIKVCFLNDSFKTRIGNTMQIAIDLYHVRELDKRLQQGDHNLVNSICHYRSPSRNWHFYSFATKYCHIHNP